MMTSAGAALRSRVVFSNSMIADVVAPAQDGPELTPSPVYAQVTSLPSDYAMTLVGGQVLGDEPAYRTGRRVSVPSRALQQPLHPVRALITGALGQRPAVLA